MGSVINAFTAPIGAAMQNASLITESNYKAGIEGQNAAISSAQGAQALRAGDAQAGIAETRGSQLASTQKADYAASGVVAGSGTASTVQLDTKAMSDLDAATIQNNAVRTAWGHQVQTSQYEQQAGLDLYSAKNQEAANSMSAFSSSLSGLTSFAASAGGGSGGGSGPNYSGGDSGASGITTTSSGSYPGGNW